MPLFTASQENSSWTMRKCRRAVNLADKQANGARCGDNGIFKGLPVTKEQKTLSQIARDIFSVYSYDGKCILDGNRLILCQSNVSSDALREKYPGVAITPLGEWAGGDPHGKELSKANCQREYLRFSQSPYRFCKLFFWIKVKRTIACKMQKTALAEYSMPIVLFGGFARDCRMQ